MPRLASLLCLAGAVSSGVPGCINASDATDVAEDHRAIVGGVSDTGDPAVALLDLGDGICTGTLISPRVIVTAQHCLVGPASAITAHFVNEYGEMGRPMASATAHETHPNADIGAIALAEPITSIAPIPLNTTPIEGVLGQTVRFVGFGVTSEDGADSGLKRQGSSTLSSTSPDGIDFFQGEMATATGGQSTCYGDSGGPNFMTFAGVEYIAGITSRGTDICGVGLDIAVRIDAHMDFLRSFIDRHDAATCSADGRCTEGCATIDPDCCVADSACVEECGASDADCADPTDPGTTGDGDRHYEGGCSAAGGGSDQSAWWLVLAIAGVVARASRRRRR